VKRYKSGPTPRGSYRQRNATRVAAHLRTVALSLRERKAAWRLQNLAARATVRRQKRHARVAYAQSRPFAPREESRLAPPEPRGQTTVRRQKRHARVAYAQSRLFAPREESRLASPEPRGQTDRAPTKNTTRVSLMHTVALSIREAKAPWRVQNLAARPTVRRQKRRVRGAFLRCGCAVEVVTYYGTTTCGDCPCAISGTVTH